MQRPSSRVKTDEEARAGVNTFMGLDKTDPCFCPFIKDSCKTNCLCYHKPGFMHLAHVEGPKYVVHDSTCQYADYVKGESD